MLIFDLSDPFCTLILRGIEKALDPTGYLPVLMDAHNDRRQLLDMDKSLIFNES